MHETFHPLVQEWFEDRFHEADRTANPQLAADPRRRGRARLGADRLRQDPRRVPILSRRFGLQGGRWDASRGDAGRLRLPAQGADQRRPQELGASAGRAAGPRGRTRVGAFRNSHGGTHRRYAGERAAEDAAQAAARARHDAGIALHSPNGRQVARTVPQRFDHRRRRNSRDGQQQARVASCPNAGAA